MKYTIDDFWTARLGVRPPPSAVPAALPPGWGYITTGLSEFVEAPISLVQDGDSSKPDLAGDNVIFVSAPGAVGKTTLAQQIAFTTRALIVDLAVANAVGDNTLSGGLAKSGLHNDYASGNTAVVIDGLDEARIKVTQEAMGAFMQDVLDLSRMSRFPIVIFGRTGSIEEAWLLLADQIQAPILEIGYFEFEDSVEFTCLQTKSIREERQSREPDKRAARVILQSLQKKTLLDGGSFVGYSPVLIAVANRIASEDSPDNTQKLISDVENSGDSLTLDSIVGAILEREQGKLKHLSLSDQGLNSKLYSAEEQISRLVARVYGTEPKITLPAMSPDDREIYSNVLDSWVTEHPFLDGEGRRPSSAVFGGLLAAKALKDVNSSETALAAELEKGASVNPFLAEFYIPSGEAGEKPSIPSQHLAAIYASVRSRLPLNEYASLVIDQDSVTGGNSEILAEIEIMKFDAGEQPREQLQFHIAEEGAILFGPYIEDVDIVAPSMDVRVLGDSEAKLVAPISIEARSLTLDVNSILVERPTAARKRNDDTMNSVSLAAAEANVAQVTGKPKLRPGVTLNVTWPNSAVYPWNDFSSTAPNKEDERLDEGILRLKRILRLFRARGKDRLAKLADAITHSRRSQGVGDLIRQQLLKDEVLTVQGKMYVLGPDKLANATGLTFQKIRSAEVPQATVDFVNRALNGGE